VSVGLNKVGTDLGDRAGALAILDMLDRGGKLTAAQKGWRKRFLDALAALPPEAADTP